MSAAKEAGPRRQAVVTTKTGIFAKGWDFMAKLIMIFAGVQGKARAGKVMMGVYSSLLLAVLVLGAPYWLLRMATSGRYRAGLAGRLGRVPEELRAAVAGRDVIWVHAVSVGEVMAATQLIRELKAALPGWVVAVSTTTETGQGLAKERLSGSPVFYLPLDFAVVVRRYLRVLRAGDAGFDGE